MHYQTVLKNTTLNFLHHDVHDLKNVRTLKRPKHNRRIDTVKELRLEPICRILHRFQNTILNTLVIKRLTVSLTKVETKPTTRLNQIRTQVRSHHNHSVLEINPPTLRVSQVTIFKYL